MEIQIKRYFVTTKENLTIYALILAVFKPYFLPDGVISIFRVVFLGYVLLFLFLHRKLKYLINLSNPFAVMIIVSCVLNYFEKKLSIYNLNFGVLYALCAICMGAMIKYCLQKNTFLNLLHCLRKIFFIYFLISIMSMLIQERNTMEYAFGSKFMTSYIILLMPGLFYTQCLLTNHSKDKVKFYFIVLASFFALIYMETITGLISYLAFIMLCIFGKKILRLLSNPYFFVIAVISSLLILLTLSAILQIGGVQRIITGILHKDITLTDRMRYYSRALHVFNSGNIWFGAGYASSLLRNSIGLGSNIQNGLLQHVLSYGVLGGIAFIIICFRGLNIKCAKIPDESLGIIAVLYAFVLAAIVEVSYNHVFLLTLFLAYGMQQTVLKVENNQV